MIRWEQLKKNIFQLILISQLTNTDAFFCVSLPILKAFVFQLFQQLVKVFP